MANANGNKVGKAVRAALAFMFGGKRSNGFVNTAGATKPGELAQDTEAEGADLMAATLVHTLKPQSLNALMAELRKQTGAPRPSNAPILETEKDGRLYAIALFAAMEEAAESAVDSGFSVHSAEAEEVAASDSSSIIIYRDRPQSDVVARYIADLYKYGTEAAIGGFYVVLTDYIGSVIEGTIPDPASGYYADMEKEGRLEPWGSVIYRDPAKSALALAAKKNLYQLEPKQSHAEPTVSDVMQKCAADIREINRNATIEASKGNAERWAERVKRAKASLRGIEVEDFNWGALFTGSKAALIKAGLLSAQFVPAKGKEKEYQLPLNRTDGWWAACHIPGWGKIPPSWDAKVSQSQSLERESGYYSVWVDFDKVNDLNIRERTERAFEEMDRPDVNMALLRRLVAEIPPIPLSVAVPEQIAKAKLYPKAGK